MGNALRPIDLFDGAFENLPLAAHLRYGVVPMYPTSQEFHAAACRVADDLDIYAEAHWYIEAIRERRLNPGRLLDDARVDINTRVAGRLFARAREAS